MERSQQELEYWQNRADQMRSVIDDLETDYLTHRTDCFVVRQRRLRDAVGRALDALAGLEGTLPAASSTSGRSSPTENDSLLPAHPPPSTVSASTADFSRNMRRLAARSELKCTLQCSLTNK